MNIRPRSFAPNGAEKLHISIVRIDTKNSLKNNNPVRSIAV